MKPLEILLRKVIESLSTALMRSFQIILLGSLALLCLLVTLMMIT